MKSIVKQKDPNGRTRFFVLPVENESGFKELMRFVNQEIGCDLESLDEGPGTLVQVGKIGTVRLIFVLSDSTGAQFYAENEEDIDTVERIATAIEARLSELIK